MTRKSWNGLSRPLELALAFVGNELQMISYNRGLFPHASLPLGVGEVQAVDVPPC